MNDLDGVFGAQNLDWLRARIRDVDIHFLSIDKLDKIVLDYLGNVQLVNVLYSFIGSEEDILLDLLADHFEVLSLKADRLSRVFVLLRHIYAMEELVLDQSHILINLLQGEAVKKVDGFILTTRKGYELVMHFDGVDSAVDCKIDLIVDVAFLATRWVYGVLE